MKITDLWGTAVAFLVVCFLPTQALGAVRGDPGHKKEQLSLGSEAPDFRLPDVVSGSMVSRSDMASQKVLLVIFLCRQCPYVQHVKNGIIRLANDYADRGVGFVAISSNDPAAYPEDAPEKLKEMAVTDGFPMPLLFDETQEVARAYGAVATPDFFMFDQGRKLVYRGQMDSSRPGSGTPVTGKDVREALDAVLEDRPVSPDQKPPVGCSIKWKKK